MLRKFFIITIVILVTSSCVGTMKIADTPSKKVKGATVQTKVDNNSTKK